MQPNIPRPSLQPIRRQADPISYGRGGVQVPQRGMSGPAANPVDRAMMHDFGGSSHVAPSGYGHYSSSQKNHTPTYANSTQALFAAPEPTHTLTPYQQMYHYNPVKNPRSYHFPFRALMILLVVGAISFGAYAVYRAFTNPSPVNAEPPYGGVVAP